MKMVKSVYWLLTACALLAIGTMTRADVRAGEYVLGTDDVITIIVKNHQELNATATITKDGTIALVEVGEVKAAGMTARALAANIQTELEKTLNDVSVSVTVKEVHPPKLTVGLLGSAARAVGFVDIKPKWRLIDLLAFSGGLTTKPKLVIGRIVRNGDVIELNVQEAFVHPEGPANVLLQASDLVLIEEKDNLRSKITVLGQVARPGPLDLDPTSSLPSVLTEAGGPLPRAALNKSYVLRKGERIPVNLVSAAAGRNPIVNGTEFKLAPDDLVFVPENDDHYQVIGEAKAPGTFPYPVVGKVTVLQAFMQVGGKTKEGDLDNAAIVRFSNGKYNAVPVNIAKLLDKKPTGVDLPLEPGDTLYIPTRRSRGGLSLNALTNILSPLSALRLIGLF